MIDRSADPRTEDTIVFELLRAPRSGGEPTVVGRAVFADGRSRVEGPDDVAVPVQELLERAFVDRVQADERPRGYRRSGAGMVDMLVPGMPEHFIARLRGLWLSYPDGTVVTARQGAAGVEQPRRPAAVEWAEAGPSVTDPSVRRASLAESTEILNKRPLVQANPPDTGLRDPSQRVGVARTDCGWIS